MSNTHVLTARRAGSHLVSTSVVGSDGVPRSRLHGRLATGYGVLLAGAVMGKVSADNSYRPVDVSATDGSDVVAGVLFSTVDTGFVKDEPPISASLDAGDISVHGEYLAIYGADMSAPDLLKILTDLETLGVSVSNLADVVVLPFSNTTTPSVSPFNFVKLIGIASSTYEAIRNIAFDNGETVTGLTILTPHHIVRNNQPTNIYDTNVNSYCMFNDEDDSSLVGQPVELLVAVDNPNNNSIPSFHLHYYSANYIPETLEVLSSTDGVTFTQSVAPTARSNFNIFDTVKVQIN